MSVRKSCILSALILATLLAEAADSPYRAPWDIEVRDGYSLEKGVFTEREIPALILTKDEFSESKKPVVILLHGGGMPDVISERDAVAKELWFLPEFYGVPYMLADGGIAVVMIDQWWAGERFKEEYRDAVLKNYLASVIRGYTETTNDVSLMLDALAERDGLDTEHAGVTGRSGGGTVALMAAARDSRVVAVTSWVGQAHLEAVAKTKMPEAKMHMFMARDPGIEELLKAYDPINRLDAMPPTAVLLMNVRTDPAIPFDVVRDFHDQLAPHYANTPEKLQFRVLEKPEPTHALAEEDYAAGCEWLITHLSHRE